LISVTYWVGGIFTYFLVLMPSLTALGPAERGKFMEGFLQRFSKLTWAAIALMGVTGVILTNQVISVSTLFSFSTRYGNVLLAKHFLILLMIVNGGYIGGVLGPKMASFAPPAGAPKPGGPGEGGPPPGPPPELLKLQARMTTLGWVQVALGAAVLLTMAL
jgi:uncharacterized membrane protein